MIHPNDLMGPSWQCVHFTEASKISVGLDELSDSKLAIIRVSVKDVEIEQELLARIAAAMRFPDYFGGNWDAFEECLRDMGWYSAAGYVLILEDSAALWRFTPQSGGKLIESWLFAAQEWAREGTSFHLVFVL